MGLNDVTGVFSRYLIVGFFVPAFFGLFVFSIAATESFLPNGFDPRSKTGVLVVGGAALLVGLLLNGLNFPIVRLFEGYPFEAVRPLRPLGRFLKWLQGRSFDRLEKQKERAEPGASAEEMYRGVVAWKKLDWSFPSRERLLPTRFGNAMRASEDYMFSRWKLDPIAIWPRIDPLLNEQERELHANAKTDVAFFINSALLAFGVGIALIANEIADSRLSGLSVLVYAVPLLLAYALYRFAIGAADRWGTELRASTDLHRLELYKTLGVRTPTSFEDERTRIARPLNRFFLFDQPLPDEIWLDGAKETPAVEETPEREDEHGVAAEQRAHRIPGSAPGDAF